MENSVILITRNSWLIGNKGLEKFGDFFPLFIGHAVSWVFLKKITIINQVNFSYSDCRIGVIYFDTLVWSWEPSFNSKKSKRACLTIKYSKPNLRANLIFGIKSFALAEKLKLFPFDHSQR